MSFKLLFRSVTHPIIDIFIIKHLELEKDITGSTSWNYQPFLKIWFLQVNLYLFNETSDLICHSKVLRFSSYWYTKLVILKIIFRDTYHHSFLFNGAGGGIRTSKIGDWKKSSPTFLRSFPPFFFLRGFRSIASLAGDEKHETQSYQLSPLRQISVRGFLNGVTTKKAKCPLMRQPENLDKWKIWVDSSGRCSTVLL